MKDDEIDQLVNTIGRTMHGSINEAGLREGEQAIAALVADALKNLNHIGSELHDIAEAVRVLAKAVTLDAASKGRLP